MTIIFAESDGTVRTLHHITSFHWADQLLRVWSGSSRVSRSFFTTSNFRVL